ncbi:hypothetical protein Bp8pS_316 [Bacillus phage vB_BpuM-BpSp]|nr:hypothetical protein Bp8pS_316 [Bacillus phage vB_BpuM-BpSp]
MIKKIDNKKKINNIVNIQSKQTKENIILSNMDGYFEERFYYSDYYDNAKMNKFIKKVENMVRKSNEYSRYIGFLKNELGLTSCAVLGNVTQEDATIEFHHYPFTLFDIVTLAVHRKIIKEENFNSFSITKEVIKDHYENIIGLTPLSVTIHELVHAGEIFINLNQVYGDINSFVEKYNIALNDEMIDKFNRLVDFSEKNIKYSESDILKKTYDM